MALHGGQGYLLLRNRQLWSLGSVVMIRSIGFGATWPYMAIFFNKDLSTPIYYVGLIFFALAIASTFCQIFGGYMADFYGRKRTMAMGSAVGLLIYAGIIAELFLHGSFLQITVLFVATSISGGLLFPAATAKVADVTSSAEREKGYAVYRIMANAGWAVGPLLGSVIVNSGIVWIFMVVEVTLGIQLILITVLLSESGKTGISTVRSGRKLGDFIVIDFGLLIFSAGTLLLMILTSQFSVTLPLYASLKANIPLSSIGLIFAVNGIVVVLGQFPVTSLVSKMREVDGVIAGIIIYMVGYLLVGFSYTLPALMFDMVIITMGENFVTPTISSIISRMAPSAKIGRYMAFNGMSNSAGRALGPAAGSIVLSVLFGNSVAVWTALDMFGAVSIAIMLAVRHMRFEEARPVEVSL